MANQSVDAPTDDDQEDDDLVLQLGQNQGNEQDPLVMAAAAQAAVVAETIRKRNALLQQAAATSHRGIGLVNEMHGTLGVLTGDPPDPLPANYAQEQRRRRFELEELFKKVKATTEWFRKAETDFYNANAMTEEHDDVLQGHQVAFQDSERAYFGRWVSHGKPVEMYLNERTAQEKAEKEEAARKNKMGDLTVPPYKGDKKEYFDFKEAFIAMTEKGNRNGVECLFQLRKHLAPNISHVLDNLGNTAADYDRAWDLLDDRFGDRRQIRQLLSDKIKHATSLTSEDNFVKLQRHHDYMKSLWTKLRSVWPERHQYERHLYSEVIRAYPSSLLEKLEERMPDENEDVEVFFGHVDAYARRADRRRTVVQGATSGNPARPTKDTGTKPKYDRKTGTAHNFAIQVAGASGRGSQFPKKDGRGNGRGATPGRGGGKGGGRKDGGNHGATGRNKDKASPSKQGGTPKKGGGNPKCQLCGSDHWVNNCKLFIEMSVPEREAKIRSLNLCLKCFSGKHFSRECTKKISCQAKQGKDGCAGRHHTMLHRLPDK